MGKGNGGGKERRAKRQKMWLEGGEANVLAEPGPLAGISGNKSLWMEYRLL